MIHAFVTGSTGDTTVYKRKKNACSSVTMNGQFILSECVCLFLMCVLGRALSKDSDNVYYEFSWNEIECPNPESSGFILGLIYSSNRIQNGMPNRAHRTVPEGWIRLGQSNIEGAGLGTFTTTFMPRYTWLGEYEGEVVTVNETEEIGDSYDYDYAWEVTKDDELSYYVDAQFEETSNWLRYVNCPRHQSEENVIALFCYGHVFYMTSRDIPPAIELLVYYGDSYAKRMGVDVKNYHNMDVLPTL